LKVAQVVVKSSTADKVTKIKRSCNNINAASQFFLELNVNCFENALFGFFGRILHRSTSVI